VCICTGVKIQAVRSGGIRIKLDCRAKVEAGRLEPKGKASATREQIKHARLAARGNALNLAENDISTH